MGHGPSMSAAEMAMEVDRYTLEAPASHWGPASDGRWRWAVDAEVWQPAGDAEGEEFRFLLELLPQGEERDGILKLPTFKDRKRALLGRLLTRRACARVLGVQDFQEFEVARTLGGKPFLATPLPAELPNFNFNVSHDGRWVVLASDPLQLVGVDVSAPQRARNDREDDTWREDLDSLLYAGEQDVISRGLTVRDRYSVFQRLWSAKEAVTKAVGRGLDFGMQRIEVQLPDLASGSFLPRWLGGQEVADLKGQQSPGQKVLEARASIDGWPTPCWDLRQHRLPADHWATVALGPVEEVEDERKQFASTLRLRGIDEEARRRAPPLAASPAFEFLCIRDLVPQTLLQQHPSLWQEHSLF